MSGLRPSGIALTELTLEVFRVNRLLREAGNDLTRPVGLSSARWHVLGVVEHRPSPVAHVARTIGLTRQSVQQTADGLEADGLIAYLENPHHRRAKLMTMTPKGREALDYVLHRHADWANRLGEQQPPAQLQAAVAFLRQVRGSLEREAAPSADTQARQEGAGS